MNVLMLRDHAEDTDPLERVIRNFWVALRLGKLEELLDLVAPNFTLLEMVIDQWEAAVAHFARYRRLDVGACAPIDAGSIAKASRKTASSLFGGRLAKHDRIYLVHITTDTFTPPTLMGVLLRKQRNDNYLMQRIFDPYPLVDCVKANNIDLNPNSSAGSGSSPAV